MITCSNAPGLWGSAILWKKKIDHLVNDISDGSYRIKCVEIKTDIPMVVLSVLIFTMQRLEREPWGFKRMHRSAERSSFESNP